MTRVDTGGWRGSWLSGGGGEARGKVRMSVSVSVEETSRRKTAESGGVWEVVKTAGGSWFIYRGAAGPGGDARQTARRTSTSGCSDP
jgi:hypothetical protein